MIRQAHLDSVVDSIKEVAAPDAQEDRVAIVINDVVSRDRRKTGALQPVQTPLDLYFVLLGQQLVWPRHTTTTINILLVYNYPHNLHNKHGNKLFYSQRSYD